MANPFLRPTPERAKLLEEQERERLRWGHAEHFRFSDYPAIAFDLDHTLAIYRLPQLHKLIYDAIVASLRKGPYAGIDFRPFGEIDLRFAQRGIFYDKQRGVMMKLDGNGEIAQAYHGTTLMPQEEIDDIYAGCRQLITLKYGPFVRDERQDPLHPVIHCFNDHFTTATIYLLMELVQLYIDGKKTHMGFERPFRHLMEAYSRIFNPDDFRLGRAGFFSAIRDDPSRYLYRVSYNFIRFLKKLRAQNIATMIVTNSAPDFANFVLNFIVGAKWKAYFDGVVYDSKKPYFFCHTKRPFYWVDDTTIRKGVEADPDTFKAPLYLSQGSMSGLKYITKATNTHFTNQLIYVGDSLVSEIYACACLRTSAIIAIISELNDEYESEWGPMLGTAENPSFWHKRLEGWARAWAASVEELGDIEPTKDIKKSGHRFKLIKDGRALPGPPRRPTH